MLVQMIPSYDILLPFNHPHFISSLDLTGSGLSNRFSALDAIALQGNHESGPSRPVPASIACACSSILPQLPAPARMGNHQARQIMSLDIHNRPIPLFDEPQGGLPPVSLQPHQARARSVNRTKSVVQQVHALVTTIWHAANTEARWQKIPYAPDVRLPPGIVFAAWAGCVRAVSILSLEPNVDIEQCRYLVRLSDQPGSVKRMSAKDINRAVAQTKAISWSARNAAHYPSLTQGILLPS